MSGAGSCLDAGGTSRFPQILFLLVRTADKALSRLPPNALHWSASRTCAFASCRGAGGTTAYALGIGPVVRAGDPSDFHIKPLD